MKTKPKAIRLKLNDTQKAKGHIPAKVLRAKQYLEQMQYGEAETTRGLADKIEISREAFRGAYSTHALLEPFKIRWANRMIWGNADTIKAIRSGQIIIEQ